MALNVLLEDVEKFLEALNQEKLSKANSSKRKTLLKQLKQYTKESKTDEPVAPTQSKFDQTQIGDVQDQLYMDLDESAIPSENVLTASVVTKDAESGSGYESYASDEENTTRLKLIEEENRIEKYFAGTNVDMFSLIFLENKSLLSKTKWLKRIGIVKENRFQCFKKLGDTSADLDFPLQDAVIQLNRKENTCSMIVNIEMPGRSVPGCRFYVEHSKATNWMQTLQDKCGSVTILGSLISSSSGKKTGLSHNDKVVQQCRQCQDGKVGKGLKTAVVDIFKKDKTWQRILSAEKMGAKICGCLHVFCNGKWVKKLCLVKEGKFFVYGRDDESSEQAISLLGCDVKPDGETTGKASLFKLNKTGKELLYVQTSTSIEMGKWLIAIKSEISHAETLEAEATYILPNDISDEKYDSGTFYTYVDMDVTTPPSLPARNRNPSSPGNAPAELSSNAPISLNAPWKAADEVPQPSNRKTSKGLDIEHSVLRTSSLNFTEDAGQQSGKRDILMTMERLSVKMDELRKYTSAATSAKERIKLEKIIASVQQEYSDMEEKLMKK